MSVASVRILARDLRARLMAPELLARLELLRVLVPVLVLLFLASRILEVDDWLGATGFHVPDLHLGDDRQPVYLAPLGSWAARAVAVALVASGVALAAGAWTRVAAAIFVLALIEVTLLDRLATFTVTKIGAVLALALFLGPAGARWSVDALRRTGPAPRLVAAGHVRAFQLFLVCFYCAAGICKLRGDWLVRGDVIYSQIHDSYQTGFACALGRLLPAWSWKALQGATLVFETLAPLWFAVPRTRPYALGFGLAMHLLIGLMFGPLLWFSLLMMALLVACFAPARWLDRPGPAAQADGAAGVR